MTPAHQPSQRDTAHAKERDTTADFLLCMSIVSTLEDVCALVRSQMQRHAQETVRGVHTN